MPENTWKRLNNFNMGTIWIRQEHLVYNRFLFFYNVIYQYKKTAFLWYHVFTQHIIAGLPRAQSARWTEPHTHRIWSTSFHLVVMWLTERTYASTDCKGGVGETIKREGGVSQAHLGKSTSCILDIPKMVNWQLSKQVSHWPVSHDHIAGSCVNSSRWRDLFGSCLLTS